MQRDGDLRVGLIGYGLAGAVFHAPLIAATPGLELAAIVTANPERAAQAQRDHPGAEVIATAEDLLARAAELGLDLAVVASPNRTHVPLARAALEAGLHVVVDKPLAATAEEGRALAQLAAERGRLLSVFHNRRWDGDFLTVRRLIDEGALGRVLRFESRFERWRPQPKEGWRESGDPTDAGGALYDLGSHLVDQALQLFGEATEVYAELDRRRPGVEVDDDAFVALHHASGARSHLWMSMVAADLGPRFRVLGDKAAYVKHGLDPQEAALRDGARPGDDGWGTEPPARFGRLGALDDMKPVPTERGAYEQFYAQIAAALKAGDEGAPVPVPAIEAVDVLAVLDAARRSAGDNTVVAL